jgi:hypothetical protein
MTRNARTLHFSQVIQRMKAALMAVLRKLSRQSAASRPAAASLFVRGDQWKM